MTICSEGDISTSENAYLDILNTAVKGFTRMGMGQARTVSRKSLVITEYGNYHTTPSLLKGVAKVMFPSSQPSVFLIYGLIHKKIEKTCVPLPFKPLRKGMLYASSRSTPVSFSSGIGIPVDFR